MSFLTTEAGHVRLATLFLENNSFWIGRGTLPDGYKDEWSTTNIPSSLTVLVSENITKSAAGIDPLSNTPVYNIVSVTSLDESTTYVEGTSFTLDNNSINWIDNAPQPDDGVVYIVNYRYVNEEITSLINEVDTMKASVVSYCYPDERGVIEAGGQHWTSTETPTKYVYLYFKYPGDISLGETIYQVGVFVNRSLNTTNDTRATPSENVVDPGTLVFIDNIAPFTQVELVRQYVEIVLEF